MKNAEIKLLLCQNCGQTPELVQDNGWWWAKCCRTNEMVGSYRYKSQLIKALTVISEVRCLMADCEERQAHFCVTHVLEVYCL